MDFYVKQRHPSEICLCLRYLTLSCKPNCSYVSRNDMLAKAMYNVLLWAKVLSFDLIIILSSFIWRVCKEIYKNAPSVFDMSVRLY
jgi:hypothetical protein